MTINPIRILISETYNPISGSLKKLICELSNKVQLTEKERCADIIVSFSYHNEDDILEMNTMSNMALEFPDKKIVFLSWFHPMDDYDKYRHLFNPGNPACVLMDTNRYRILQLPVNKEILIDNILELNKFD